LPGKIAAHIPGAFFLNQLPAGGHHEPVSNLVFRMASMGLNDFGDNPAFYKVRGLSDHFNLKGGGFKNLHLLIRVFHVLLKALPDLFNIHNFLLTGHCCPQSGGI
jgi:hypothetical protein